MSLSGLDDVGLNTTCSVAKSILFYCALAFLTGYASKSFLTKLQDLSHTLFEGPGKSEDKKEP
jgi:hypothetical protein